MLLKLTQRRKGLLGVKTSHNWLRNLTKKRYIHPFIEWLESIGMKFDIIGIMKSFLKELQRVLSLVMFNIFEDHKTDKYLYE